MEKVRNLAQKFAKWMSVDTTMKYIIGVVVLVALIALGTTWWYIETHPTYKGNTNGGGLKVEESGENADTGKFEAVDEDGKTESEKNKDKDKDKGNSGGGLTNPGTPSGSGNGNGTGSGNGNETSGSKGEVYGPIF